MKKNLLGTAILVFLALAAVYLGSRSSLARFANLRLPETSLRESYVQMKVGSSEKCLVTDRAGTTEKRSEDALAKASWKCRRPGEDGALIAISKNRPSYLYVPHAAVDDLAYPWVYEVAREGEEELLPRLRWVHFFFNRQFQGLYLQVTLPGRDYGEKRGLGRLELLAVRGDEVVCFDRKMRPVCRVLTAAIADGVLPQPEVGEVAALLTALSPPAASTYFLSEQQPGSLRPFPIPLSLGAVVPTAEDPYRDQRYRAWQTLPEAPAAARQRLLERLGGRREELREHLADLGRAIAASCAVQTCEAGGGVDDSPTLRWLREHGMYGA